MPRSNQRCNRPRTPTRTASLHQLRVGHRRQEGVEVVLPRHPRRVPASPAKIDFQLFGGPPSGPGSAQTYQSRFSESFDERDSTNSRVLGRRCGSARGRARSRCRARSSRTAPRDRRSCRAQVDLVVRPRRSPSPRSASGRSGSARGVHAEPLGTRGARPAAQVADTVAVRSATAGRRRGGPHRSATRLTRGLSRRRIRTSSSSAPCTSVSSPQ